MAEFLTDDKKVIIKIVYYGPALSGKTTNLMHLHDLMTESGCGELMTLETKGDRTLFFDLLPLMVTSKSDVLFKIKLFTVPGQVAHDATRKAVLSRADGIVFVADSQITQAVNNFISFDNLEKNAGRVGIDFDRIPLVVQFNKRDLDNIMTEEEVRKRWKPTGLPVFFSSAIHGRGVAETFREILMKTFSDLDAKHGLKQNGLACEDDFRSIISMIS